MACGQHCIAYSMLRKRRLIYLVQREGARHSDSLSETAIQTVYPRQRSGLTLHMGCRRHQLPTRTDQDRLRRIPMLMLMLENTSRR